MGDSDAVHVHNTLLGEALAHGDGVALLGLVLGLSDDASLSELLEAVADVLASSHPGVLALHATVSLATVVLAEALNANLLSHVQLVADRGGTGVKPVVVERAKLMEASSLDGLGPLLNKNLSIIASRDLIEKSRRRDKMVIDTRI